MRLRVKYLDGTEVDVTASASARHLWEQKHGALFDAMRSGSSNWADFLAHTTLRRKGETDTELLDWLDDVETVQWAMPESKLRALADSIGVTIDDTIVDPTEGPEPAPPSPDDSSTSRSTRASRSKGSSDSATNTPTGSTS